MYDKQPVPDPEMVKASLADHAAGRYITTEEYLAKLEAQRIAENKTLKVRKIT